MLFSEGLRTDDDNDFGVVFEFEQHFEFAVRLKSRQNARRVVIVEQFTAEFEIKFAAKLRDTLADMLGLRFTYLSLSNPIFVMCAPQK